MTLMDRWEGADASEWRDRWRLPALQILETVESTNDILDALARDGAPAGAVVLADYQSAGRGRQGRRWLAPPGDALLISVLLRPVPVDDAAVGTIPLRVGLAAARALAGFAAISIKWPNDLVAADGAKVGGILCESRVPGAVVAGIGINVQQSADDLPEGATSLRLLAGSSVSRASIAGILLDALRPLFTAPARPLGDDERRELDARDCLRGRDITVDGRPAGKAEGFAPDGSLLVRDERGLKPVRAGTIRLLSQGVTP